MGYKKLITFDHVLEMMRYIHGAYLFIVMIVHMVHIK